MVYIRGHIRHSSKLWAAALIITFTFSACKKFVAIDPPVNQVVSSVVFTNDGTATAAVVGIYSEMMSTSAKFSAGEVTFYAGMSADELTAPAGVRDEFIKNQITQSSHGTIFSIFWEKAYKFIYTANICLEGLNQSTQLTPAIKNRLIGECKFIRAFCYFHLVNLFGDVPLSTVSDYQVNAVLPRAPVADVYLQIVADLMEAQKLLNAEYPTAEKVRPNKWTVTSLLARVYLYTKEWSKAEAEATSIITLGNYRLINLDKVFLKTSDEAIWQLLPVNTTFNNTWEGNVILPPSNSVSYMITDTLLKSFEPGDLRRTNWVASRVIPSTGQTIFYPYKYRAKMSTPAAKTEYYMVFRLAEQFLIRAEARVQQNKLSEAILDIDTIRHRAGLLGTNANSQSTILAAIEQERKIELFAEWGHRWYDLKRTNRANTILGGLKSSWQSTDALWPIPVSQLIANPALTQNPGY